MRLDECCRYNGHMFEFLTPEQAQAFGKLNISFMALDGMLSETVCDLMQCYDMEVAEQFVLPMKFGPRIEKLKQLLDHHSKKRTVNETLVRNLYAAAERAQAVSLRRNELIHARLELGSQKPILLINNKTGAEVDINVAKLEELDRKAWAATLGLGYARNEFMDHLHKLQEMERLEADESDQDDQDGFLVA